MGCDGIWEKFVENSQGLVEVIKKKINEEKDNRTIM